MNKILFKVRALGMGGIERLTVDILNNLKLEDKEIILMIEDEEEKGLDKQLSPEIKKVYLKPKWFNPLLNKVKNKKRNIFEKIYYNFLLFLERQILSYNINKYIKSDKEIKLFIDYDGGSTKYIHRIRNVKKIIWQHISISNMSEKKKKRYGKRLNNYDLIVSICEEMRKELLRDFPILKNKIKQIYNFINIDQIEQKLKEKIKIEDKEILKENYCIMIGRLTEVKDYYTVIEAFRILKDRGISENLYIIGDGFEKENLLKNIKEKGLKGRVFLLGQKENPYIFLKNAKLFIHSSKLEGFGLVLLEAFACGIPVISSKYKCGATEILQNGKNGILFDVGDYKQLAEKIETILIDKKIQDIYVKNGFKRLEDFFKTKILNEYKEIFEEYSKND